MSEAYRPAAPGAAAGRPRWIPGPWWNWCGPGL